MGYWNIYFSMPWDTELYFNVPWDSELYFSVPWDTELYFSVPWDTEPYFLYSEILNYIFVYREVLNYIIVPARGNVKKYWNQCQLSHTFFVTLICKHQLQYTVPLVKTLENGEILLLAGKEIGLKWI
jgi:hypothetical protein